MMNYMKSELYRVFHTTTFYLYMCGLVVCSFLLNLGICCFGNQYATTSFSYSNIVSNPMIYPIMGAITVFILYEGNHRNGNLKNTVSSGISRTKIFAGKCIVSSIICTLLMAGIMAVWIISTEALLEKTGPVQLKTFLLEVPAVYLIAIACVISSVLALEFFEQDTIGTLALIMVWIILPRIFLYLGMRIPMIHEIAMWLPDNFFHMVNGEYVNTRMCITIWDTPDGWIRCIISGLAGTVLFSLIGLISLRRKDL